MRSARSLPFLAVVLLCAALSPAHAAPVSYEVTGRLVPIGPADPAGLAGARFRITMTIDASAAAARVDRTNDRDAATYASGSSTLELRDAAPGLAGVYRASTETLEVSDTYAGDFCVGFASRFETSRGPVVGPTVCFARGTAHGSALPTEGISTDAVIGFQPVAGREALYAVDEGSIRILGGAQ